MVKAGKSKRRYGRIRERRKIEERVTIGFYPTGRREKESVRIRSANKKMREGRNS
jgi:hypothetical protein